jgi:hypothetical protein
MVEPCLFVLRVVLIYTVTRFDEFLDLNVVRQNTGSASDEYRKHDL